MNRHTVLLASGALAAVLAVAPGFLRAAEPSKAEAPTPTSAKAGTGADVPPGREADADLTDPAFDCYVDLRLALRARQASDASLMADAALQLAEGERVLGRTHKSGVTAVQLLAAAAALAGDAKDKATLDRLGKAADARGDKALVAQVGAGRKLADQSRAADPALETSADTTTPEQFAAFADLLHEIRAARLAGDAEKLHAIEKRLPDAPALTADRRDYARSLLKDAYDTLPNPDSDAAKLNRTLDKLALASRGPLDELAKLDPTAHGTPANNAVQGVQQQINQNFNPNPVAGRDFTHINVKNSTNQAVWVALRIDTYQRPTYGTPSTLSSTGGGGGVSPFDTYAWYKINPGDTAYIADTANINVYLYAEGGGHSWKGDHNVVVRDGNQNRTLPMQHQFVVAPTNESWTINLAP